MGYKHLVRVLPLAFALAFAVGCSKDDDNNDTTGPTGGQVILQGVITEDMTLTNDHEYLLRGGVFVGTESLTDAGDDVPSVTLTIEPGTVIKGEGSTIGTLTVRRNSKIMAEGTASAPIVFTSNYSEGERGRGDWGGLVINGRATTNLGVLGEGEGATGFYGAIPGNDSDNSGTLKYVRVEFAGRKFTAEDELNGIAFQGVGSGTTVDYVQCHMNSDDGMEFFGGTVGVKHIYMSGNGDDNFDWTAGWRGNAQFLVIQQRPDEGNRGFECDNRGGSPDATPRAHPIITNFTAIGQKSNSDSDFGMILRVGTAGNFSNGIVMNFGTGVNIDDASTFNNAIDPADTTLNGELTVDYTLFYENDHFGVEDTGTPFTSDMFVTEMNAHNMLDVNPMLTAPLNLEAPNFLPQAGSPALVAANASNPPSNTWFDQTAKYLGAFKDVNWLSGWTTAAAN